MKWFFAFNQESPNFSEYAEMIKVAVATARRHTQLEPCFLYDGPAGGLTAWLGGRGVTVIHRRWRLLDEFNRVAAASGRTQLLGYAGGIFLRLDIPRICAELGWGDEEVLYTDCDVMFTGDPEPLFPDLRGAFFGAGPEFDRGDVEKMNSGVLLLRLPALRAVEEGFEAFLRANLAACAQETDQFAYRTYFRHGWRGLPDELNWKPYWGENPDARIVHFHGPKPFNRAALAAGGGAEMQRKLAYGGYQHYCRLWDEAPAGA